MARIVIDCRMWGESGVGRYIRNLVSNLQELDSKNEYYLILLEKDFNSDNDQILKNIPKLSSKELGRLPRHFAPRNDNKKNFYKVLGDFRWYGVKEQIKLPQILKQIKPDLVHLPHFNVPILYRGKYVVTIHDLIHQHFQMRRASTHDPLTYRIKSFGYKTVFQNALRRSQKIIVPSNYVKNLLVNEWKVDDKKVVVTYEAVDETILRKIPDSKVHSQETLEKFKIKQQYILYVGNAHPHKNVEGLIKSFLELRKEYQDLQLVLVGNNHYFWERIRKEYSIDSRPAFGEVRSRRLRGNDNGVKDIIYTGFVTDEELVSLYKNASVFVMPSFEEGFGIPILEAFANGCPVVSSNAGSLPEVGDKAALYFDPTNQEEMIEKIKEVLNDQKLRSEIIKKGMIRVADFSWKKLAKKTLEVYLENSNRS